MKQGFYDDPKTGKRVYWVIKSYRTVVNGKSVTRNFRRKTTDPIKNAKNVVQAHEISRESSLTSLKFQKCVELYLKERGTGGFNNACYTRASGELGKLYPDRQSFAAAYSQYCSKLEASTMAVNTVKNYKIVVRTVCNFAFRTGRCGVPAVREWNISFGEERNRILSDGEKLRIENVMRKTRSPLLPHFLFSLVNPIRKQDLLNLPRSALKTEFRRGRRVFWVELVQQKTGRRKKVKITKLPNVDEDFAKYEASIPADCPWLFPILLKDERGEVKGWYKTQDVRTRFNTILRSSGVSDFFWHDLNHCAVTYMVKQGFTYQQMHKLGIKSPRVLKIYDNQSTDEIIDSVLGRDPRQHRKVV